MFVQPRTLEELLEEYKRKQRNGFLNQIIGPSKRDKKFQETNIESEEVPINGYSDPQIIYFEVFIAEMTHEEMYNQELYKKRTGEILSFVLQQIGKNNETVKT